MKASGFPSLLVTYTQLGFINCYPGGPEPCHGGDSGQREGDRQLQDQDQGHWKQSDDTYNMISLDLVIRLF